MQRQDNLAILRVAYDRLPVEDGCVDLVVTPRALVYFDQKKTRKYFKPIDFLSPEDIVNIKHWSAERVMVLAAEWKEKGKILPLLIETVGADLCFLLEYLKIADLVLTRAWNRGDFTRISVDAFEIGNNMIQHEWANYGYYELLYNKAWCKKRSIKFEEIQYKSSMEAVYHKDPFVIPFWKKCVYTVLGLYRCSQRINMVSMIGMKMGFAHIVIPKLIVAPTRNVEVMLRYKGSVSLNDYLLILPKEKEKAKTLQSELISLLEEWFSQKSPAMEGVDLYKEIIERRLTGFIKKRLDLIIAYIQIKGLKNSKSIKMLLGSALGCGADAWCSMGIQENGGIVASGQHGGGYGNSDSPYARFSDLRYKYFFSFGQLDRSYLSEYQGNIANAKWVVAGSPALYKIRQSCRLPPKRVAKVLYVMKLCVPFYSFSFPWDNILEQFKVLELLNTFSGRYSIDVKEARSSIIKQSNYPGLRFINERPEEVLHGYDLLIVESGVSTVLLEAASTNKFMVVFTGGEWEDVSQESLDMLSKRTECFNNWNSFLSGLKGILENPKLNLNATKLNSSEFVNTYCNPASPEKYVNIIKETFGL